MEYKLGKTALLAVMKTLQDALLEGRDASQGLRDLRFTASAGVLEVGVGASEPREFTQTTVGGSAGGFKSEF